MALEKMKPARPKLDAELRWLSKETRKSKTLNAAPTSLPNDRIYLKIAPGSFKGCRARATGETNRWRADGDEVSRDVDFG